MLRFGDICLPVCLSVCHIPHICFSFTQ